ncbi:hypothetical protein BJY01DRAFT_251091 [Aspergillus pseudoustus]|uniref:Rhodopsin domain-containing protein n=1 Tax=Aspergillus pseudoustus TaxID=1810923 RepID=A0ABR4JDS8_9EURO
MPKQGRTGLSENTLLQISLSTQILCYTLVTLFVILRLVLQRRLGKPFSADDDAFCGGAEKESNLTVSEIETSFKVSYASTIFYAPLALSVKVTLLLVLAKIYRPCRFGTIAIYATLALNMFYYTTILFVKAFICNPVSAYWTSKGEPSEKCLNRFAVIAADSSISVISDIAILVLPIILTWPLQMAARLKVKVMALLGLGGVAVGFSLYRLVLVVTDRNSPDQTILFMRVLLSGNAEGGIGLICACLPALSKYHSHRRSSRHEGQGLLDNSPQAKQQRYLYNHDDQWPGIFDGSQGRDSLQSHKMETRIWRSSTSSAAGTCAAIAQHDIGALSPDCSSSIAIRKDVTVRQQLDDHPP